MTFGILSLPDHLCIELAWGFLEFCIAFLRLQSWYPIKIRKLSCKAQQQYGYDKFLKSCPISWRFSLTLDFYELQMPRMIICCFYSSESLRWFSSAAIPSLSHDLILPMVWGPSTIRGLYSYWGCYYVQLSWMWLELSMNQSCVIVASPSKSHNFW